MADYNFLLETRLSQDQQLSLQILQRVCRARNLNLYLTGGPMRDLLSGRPVRMLEIVTEGDPLALAPDLRAAGAERLSSHAPSSSLRFHLRGGRVRVLAAHGGTIIQDLRRRGLTLNSIGLSLNPASRALPLDPNNGAADIEARLIRMNHPYVFFEEPVVALRALRLRARLEFALEERTAARLESAREGGYLERATPLALGQELEAIAYEPDPATILRALEREGWLEAAYGKGVKSARMNLAGLARLNAAVESWEQLGLVADSGLLAMPMLLAGLSSSDQTRLTQVLPSRHLADWKKVPHEAKAFEKHVVSVAAAGTGWPRRLQEVIEKTSAEAVIWAFLEPSDAKAGKKLKEFHALALQARQRLPLGVLRALGLAPHSLEAESWLLPLYRRLLAAEPLTDSQLAESLRTAIEAARAPKSVPPPAVKRGHTAPPAVRGAGAQRVSADASHRSPSAGHEDQSKKKPSNAPAPPPAAKPVRRRPMPKPAAKPAPKPRASHHRAQPKPKSKPRAKR